VRQRGGVVVGAAQVAHESPRGSCPAVVGVAARSSSWPSERSSSTVSSRRPLGVLVEREITPNGTRVRVGDPQPLPGRRRGAWAKGTSGGGALSLSESIAPEATSWNSAVSATLRLSSPLTDRPNQGRGRGAIETRPRCGFRPNRPHHAAGMRIEPAPSEPSAAPTSPAATAARCRRLSRRARAAGPTGCGSRRTWPSR
jgi:hypothetical protein